MWQEVSNTAESVVYHWDADASLGMADEYDPMAVQVALTHEGIIMDAYDDNMHIGTFAKTYVELFEWLAGR